MGRKYSMRFDAVSNETASTPTFAGLISAATIRPRVYELCLGSRATPADLCATYAVQRITSGGTCTAGELAPLDPADPAALCPSSTSASGTAHSAEPTYTASTVLLNFSVNQRATYRWVANPGCELILPATAANGVGMKGVSVASAYLVDGYISWEE